MQQALTTAQPIARRRERPVRPLPHLIRGVWIQSLRRKEFYVVLILAGVYALAALVLRLVGIQSALVARFVAGLGLQLASLLAALLVIVMAARQLAEELELRTIYPIMAKPVARWQFLAGKAIPTFGVGMLALALFSLTTLAIAPHLAYQQAGVLAEGLALQALALAMLTALTLWLTLELPVSVAMLLAGALYFGGAWLANSLALTGAAGRAAACLVPDFALFSQFQRYVDGGAMLGAGPMLALAAYGVAWAALLGGLAIARFRRRPL